MTHMRYAVVIERGEENYGAYVPDLPGVISIGDSEEEAIANVRQAIALHLEGLRQAGEEIPQPRTRVAVVDAA
jgi:predicted RNase H-like HicB family nuclease